MRKPKIPHEIYCTSFCNFGHWRDTGRPVGHECYVLLPSVMERERNGERDLPSIVREPRRIVIGREAK